MSRVWIEDPPKLHVDPSGVMFGDPSPDPRVDEVDEHRCHRCSEPIGWWVDADDDGRTIGGFVAYGVSADRRRRWCEDCYPGRLDDGPDGGRP